MLPRNVASKQSFENAMALDIAMGGSTNTVLHILAAAHEGGIDFTMDDIDALSRRVPVLCKVAPAKSDVHMEDVHRAGGIMAILGELDKAGLIHRDQPTVHTATIGQAIEHWDIGAHDELDGARLLHGGAGRRADARSRSARSRRWDDLDLDRETGVIRDAAHPFSKDGGLAVLKGNIALEGCMVKTAGVDESILKFTGPAKVFESQDAAVKGILEQRGEGRRRRRHPLRGAARRAGHAGDALSDELPEIEGPRQILRAADRRALLRRHVGPVDRPRLAGSGRGRRRSAWCATATESRSTSRIARSGFSSTTPSWRRAAPRRRPRAGSRPRSASAT